MPKLAVPVALAALAVILAGCGGGSSSITVGTCLNEDENFLVQQSGIAVVGQSPTGVSFTLTLYKTEAAASSAYKQKNPKTTALVERGVVDFRGNPSPYAGAPPAKITKIELAAINRCIEKAKQ